jgi:nucleotide-binding universal stress UspA family protein
VGLDVSPVSHSALAWAANQARLTGAELRAVHSLLVPAAMWASLDQMSVPASIVDDDRVMQAYRDAVTAVWDTVQPEPSWRLEFYHANPGRLLVAESGHAGLLVIGTREHVGWGRILNGSVSHYCLSHATCPVVAVPPVITPAYESEPQLLADAEPA